jgi:hypothetical protein
LGEKLPDPQKGKIALANEIAYGAALLDRMVGHY